MSYPEWPTASTRDQYLAAGGAYEGVASYGRRPAGPGKCVLCAGVPAIPVTLRRQQGLVLLMRFWDRSGTYCRNCGIETFRQVQNASIAGGWWGVLAFFVNISTLARNAYAYWKLRALPQALGRDNSVIVPNHAPLPLGPPLIARWGFAVALLILAMWVVVANVVD